MLLDDVCMVAADTLRSKTYVQSLVRHQLLPQYIIVLNNPAASALPGQGLGGSKSRNGTTDPHLDNCWSEADFDLGESIAETIERAHIPVGYLDCTDINHAGVIEAVRERPESVVIFSGFGGALLKAEILATGKRFLHVHGGYLPNYKGSTTNYYSLLDKDELGASSLFLTADIDGGPVLHRRKFPVPADKREIDFIYDSAARARVLVDTLREYALSGRWNFEVAENKGGETYYVIHPVLKHIAILSRRVR